MYKVVLFSSEIHAHSLVGLLMVLKLTLLQKLLKLSVAYTKLIKPKFKSCN
jgi:hypothetical protein